MSLTLKHREGASYPHTSLNVCGREVRIVEGLAEGLSIDEALQLQRSDVGQWVLQGSESPMKGDRGAPPTAPPLDPSREPGIGVKVGTTVSSNERATEKESAPTGTARLDAELTPEINAKPESAELNAQLADPAPVPKRRGRRKKKTQ